MDTRSIKDKTDKKGMKKTVGAEIIESLNEFADALENGEAILERYTCRRVILDLKPTPYNPALVRKTRSILGASQAMFAKFLGVSVKTVRAWEQGINTPNDMACRFMDEIRLNEGYWRRRFQGAIVERGKPSKRVAGMN